MAARPLAITILIVIGVLLGGTVIYHLFHRPLVHHLNSDMQILGIIDNDNSHEITLNGVLNGEDSVLVVDHTTQLYQEIGQKIPQAKLLDADEVFNVNNLHLFDKNSDSVISAQDPLFEHLFVLTFFNKGQQSDIKGLPAAGIKTISISTVRGGHHEVTLSDGSQRTLYSLSKVEKSEDKTQELP